MSVTVENLPVQADIVVPDEGLDEDVARFIGSALKERVTIRMPDGGVRTELRDIPLESLTQTSARS